MLVKRQMVGPLLVLCMQQYEHTAFPQPCHIEFLLSCQGCLQPGCHLRVSSVLWQVLRCQFVPGGGDIAAMQRLVDEADAASCLEVVGIAGGPQCLVPKPDGTLEVAPGSPLHEAWSVAANAPFDLFHDPLTRLRVRLLACMPCRSSYDLDLTWHTNGV